MKIMLVIHVNACMPGIVHAYGRGAACALHSVRQQKAPSAVQRFKRQISDLFRPKSALLPTSPISANPSSTYDLNEVMHEKYDLFFACTCTV